MGNVLHEFQKNALERVRCELAEFRGEDYLSLRVFVENSDSGEWIPTRKGLTLAVSLVDELAEGVQCIKAELDKRQGVS